MRKIFLLTFCLLFISHAAFAQINHWETALYSDGIWKYHPGTLDPPADWTAPNFNDDDWLQGAGSVGYGDGDDNTIIDPVVSLYMRQNFSVIDISKIELAALHADFDDAFVAYLNGVEIARSNIIGTPPAFDAHASSLHEAVMYDGGLPEVFLLEKSLLEMLLVTGENTLSIQVHNYDGALSSDMTSLFFLSFGINDASNDYGPTPAWFESPIFSTHLPIVKINTGGEYIPDEPSIPGQMEIIYNGTGQLNSYIDVANELASNMTIERRGQSSLWVFPKNGFAVETKDDDGEDMDVGFLNFPEEEDWILHGPYSDKTLIRNVLSMKLARDMGQYASRTRYVELFINGGYEGIYVMMEKIKQGESRLDIANLKEEDIAGDELTGGYIFKVDKDEADWYSQYDMEDNPGAKLQYQYVYPKRTKIQPAQEVYIQTYVDYFEQAMNSPSLMYNGLRYDEFIDINSFVEQFLMRELSRDVDAYRISSYFHKKKNTNGGKIYAGPVWDFNIAWGNADYCESPTVEGWMYNEDCGNNNPFWWSVMLNDDLFLNALTCRWSELREGAFQLDSIFTFIDDQAALLGPAVERNFERWPILGEYVWPNPVVVDTYEEEVEIMKNWIAGRVAWMDENIMGECLSAINQSDFENIAIEIWPNPSSDKLHLFIADKTGQYFDFKLIDVFGKTIIETENNKPSTVFEIDLSSIKNGAYYCLFEINGQTQVKRIMVTK